MCMCLCLCLHGHEVEEVCSPLFLLPVQEDSYCGRSFAMAVLQCLLGNEVMQSITTIQEKLKYLKTEMKIKKELRIVFLSQ